MSQEAKPQLVNPVSEEELARLRRSTPTTEQGIFSSFEGVSNNSVANVVGGLVGLNNTDMYAIVERTNLPAKDRATMRRMIHLAEHGFGIPGYDFPIPFLARQVVMDLRLRVSETDDQGHGKSRGEVENIMTGWIAKLEAREAEAKKQKQAGAAG